MAGEHEPDFEARRLADRYGPSFRIVRRVLDGLVLATLVAVILGITRWPTLVAVVLLRLLLPAGYGWLMGRRVGSGSGLDRDD